MKKALITAGFLVCILEMSAQKKNYIGFEFGTFSGSWSKQLSTALKASQFDSKSNFNFLGVVFTTQYPVIHSSSDGFRAYAGYRLNNRFAIEAGFSKSNNSSVDGYNSTTGYFLSLYTKVNTIYANWIYTDSLLKAGIGAGPCLHFVNYRFSSINGNVSATGKKQVCPGLLVNAYWNFFHKKYWFIGLRTDVAISSKATTGDIVLTNNDNNITSTFKSAKAGSFQYDLGLTAGIRF